MFFFSASVLDTPVDCAQDYHDRVYYRPVLSWEGGLRPINRRSRVLSSVQWKRAYCLCYPLRHECIQHTAHSVQRTKYNTAAGKHTDHVARTHGKP